MLNHTYTSVKNANLVDCGKKQHIPSQPTPLLKENFLGEFRTELDKKKVLAALGIATELSLEWGNIKGNIGDSTQLMNELDLRTKYTSALDGMSKTIGAGIAYLESIVGGEEAAEAEQNERITELEKSFTTLQTDITNVQKYLTDTVDVNITQLQKGLEDISKSVENITSLIQVSAQADNALSLLEGENPGLYVPDLSGRITSAESDIDTLQADVATIEKDFVKRSEFGDGNLDFVSKSTYDSFSTNTSNRLGTLESEIKNTVKTGEDGHVDTLYVNKISKDNDSSNIQITDSFEMDSGIPLDVRAVVENLEELKALPVKVCYPGMAVVVKNLNSLYILKNPEEGVAFNKEYISDDKNWKCPEDLVTMALTRTQYDELVKAGSISESVFYYIYEEPITYTQEPVREQDETDEAWAERWNDWVRSLKILSQEYMSASWGVDIETKLGQKASLQNVRDLSEEINKLKGGGEGVSLESLNESLEELKETDATLTQRLDEILNTSGDNDSGRIVTLEESVENLSKDIYDVSSSLGDYVTTEDLKTLSNDFNFVKPDDYEKDKEAFETALANQLTTQSIKLTGSVINVQEGSLYVDSNKLAQASAVPTIEVMSKTEYDNLQKKEENTYYYTYDENTFYVTQDELKNKVDALQTQINTLGESLSALSKIVEELQKLHASNE